MSDLKFNVEGETVSISHRQLRHMWESRYAIMDFTTALREVGFLNERGWEQFRFLLGSVHEALAQELEPQEVWAARIAARLEGRNEEEAIRDAYSELEDIQEHLVSLD